MKSKNADLIKVSRTVVTSDWGGQGEGEERERLVNKYKFTVRKNFIVLLHGRVTIDNNNVVCISG